MSDPPIRRLLSPSNCPRCEYPLTGLAANMCPECGNAYDDRTVYLFGYQTTQALVRKTPMRRLILQTIIFAGMMILIAGMPTWPAVCVFGSFIAWQWWLRLADHGAGLVQVRLNREGFAMVKRCRGPLPFDKVPAAKHVPWSAAANADVETIDSDHVRIRISTFRPNDSPWWQSFPPSIEADVCCTEAERQLLLSRLAEWRRASREQQPPLPA